MPEKSKFVETVGSLKLQTDVLCLIFFITENVMQGHYFFGITSLKSCGDRNHIKSSTIVCSCSNRIHSLKASDKHYYAMVVHFINKAILFV